MYNKHDIFNTYLNRADLSVTKRAVSATKSNTEALYVCKDIYEATRALLECVREVSGVPDDLLSRNMSVVYGCIAEHVQIPEDASRICKHLKMISSWGDAFPDIEKIATLTSDKFDEIITDVKALDNWYVERYLKGGDDAET